MNLLDQIIESGTLNTPPPLASVLRQCILLSTQLKVPLLRTWALNELNGYSTASDIPAYRVMKVDALGEFEGSGGKRYSNRPIPPALLEPQHQWSATKIRLFDSIGRLESVDRDGVTYPWPPNMILHYQDKLLPDAILLQAWQFIPKSAILGLLDTIRTRVLTAAIDIKNGLEQSGVELATVEQHSPASDKAQQTIVNNILGGNFYFGDTHTQITQVTQNIQTGDWESLKSVLEQSGINEAERDELRNTLQDEKKIGDGVTGWIRRNAEKVLDKGGEVGTTLGAKVLTEVISKYLGLPPSTS